MASSQHQEGASGRLVYDTPAVEEKWQKRWQESGCFEASDDPSKPRFFNFDGGPFPNGPMHMGHVRTFTLGDVMARYQRMRGKNVLYCLEFDAFGLPNELAARQHGLSPEALTSSHIELIRGQMRRLGLSYDWRYVHTTSQPRYYRWTQWLFLKLYEAGLIYRAPAVLNWCPVCETTLAHMQVSDGLCWRCDSEVETRLLTQWFVRLEKYSETLLDTLPELDGWSTNARHLVRGFIAPTWVTEVDFEVVGSPGRRLVAFTTDEAALERIDFLSVAASRPFLAGLLEGSTNAEAVWRFLDEARGKTRQPSRRDSAKSEEQGIEGIDTGLRVFHPLTGEVLPVYVAHYVDLHFATRIEIASMATQERAENFGRRHKIAGSKSIPIRPFAPEKLRRKLYFRVHDWLVSRQRSWGTPIPVVHCASCGVVPVEESELPVELPDDLFSSDREYGLKNHEEFVRTLCPRCRQPAERETDTLDCYFDVVWCFLACATLLDEDFAFRREDFATWMPVDWFHNGLDSFFYTHLYRFLGRVLYELGILAEPEPIRRYHGHDAVLAGGRKMSKHYGNVVSPDEIMNRLGADVLRLHVIWSANPSRSVEWSDAKLERAQSFLISVWELIAPRAELIRRFPTECEAPASGGRAAALERFLARIVRRVNAFLEDYRYNACLEELHQLLKNLSAFASKRVDRPDANPEALAAFARACRTFILLLNPMAPHFCEELWERLGGKGYAALSPWPLPDEPLRKYDSRRKPAKKAAPRSQ